MEENDKLPSLAVIVAARNEEENLPTLLSALAAQEYPDSRVQFWIVDDHSSDRTGKIAEKMASLDSRFHLIKSDPEIPVASPKKRAIQTALEKVNAEWIITTDADCAPGPGWLKALTNDMKEDTGILVGFSPLTGGRSPLQLLAMGESWSAGALAAASIGLGYPFNAFGRNFAFRKAVFETVQGFQHGGQFASGDDDLFMQQVVARTDWKVRFCLDPRSFVPSKVQPRKKVLEAKVRHMSVGTHYATGWVVTGAVGSLLFLGLGLVTVLGLPFSSCRRTIGKAWKTKLWWDAIMAFSSWRLLGYGSHALLSLMTMTAAPFLFWYIWPKALFGSFEWKERRFHRGKA